MPQEKQFDVDEVLDLAVSAFWARGYWATSMLDLVETTGVNRASLYATYGDKHALFMTALRRYAETVHFRRLAALERMHAPLVAISRALLVFVPPSRTAAGQCGCFLTNTALELASHDAEVGALVRDAQRQTQAFFERQLRRAKRDGVLSAKVRPAEAAEALLASLIGLSVLNRSRPDPAMARRIAATALRRLT